MRPPQVIANSNFDTVFRRVRLLYKGPPMSAPECERPGGEDAPGRHEILKHGGGA